MSAVRRSLALYVQNSSGLNSIPRLFHLALAKKEKEKEFFPNHKWPPNQLKRPSALAIDLPVVPTRIAAWTMAILVLIFSIASELRGDARQIRTVSRLTTSGSAMLCF